MFFVLIFRANADTKVIEEISSSNSSFNFITVIKDSVNILFFIIGSIVTVLSYLQARKTIFTPLKTEVFKLQLKSFEELLEYFNKSTSGRIDERFNYDKIVNLNTSIMFDDYASHFFSNEIKLNPEKRKEKYKELIGGIVSKSYMEKHFELADDPTDPVKKKTEQIDNPALIYAQWQEYDYGMVQYTKQYDDQLKIINAFLSNPVLPSKIKKLIEDFTKQVHTNLSFVGEVITDCAKEMPSKYPNVETLKKAQFSWVWNKFNHKRVLLDKLQDSILSYISDYLSIENIYHQKKSANRRCS